MAFKPYILGPVVARGGMAEVFRGLQIGQDGFRRLVAIKRILPQFANNEEFTTMFKDEAHIGQRLQHPNIVRVECFDRIDFSACIIMEFVDGLDLRSILAAYEQKRDLPGGLNHLSPNICALIIAEAARGLHHAHTCDDGVSKKPLQIIHRDISPQNILVSWQGEVKITDFGIATADRNFKQTETKAGIVKGKFAYMSPEQIIGKKCDALSDIFSLCIVFWEMLAMKRLFTADTEMEIIDMVRSCNIQSSLSKLNPSVSPELEGIVLRGLAKDPAKRYRSMSELDKTLRRYLAQSRSTVSGIDVATFLDGILADRKESSKEDSRKLLSMQNVDDRGIRQGKNKSLALELVVDPATSDTTGLTVGSQYKSGSRGSISSTHVKLPDSKYVIAPSEAAALQPLAFHRKKPAKSISGFIWLAVATVLFLGGSVFFKKYQQSAKRSLIYSIRTDQESVKISNNGVPQYKGQYVPTLTKIRLELGINRIEISRDGYAPQTIVVSTDNNSSKVSDIIRLRAVGTPAPIRIELRGNNPASINVNNGFARKSLNPKVLFFDVVDIPNNKMSELEVVGKMRANSFSCTFTPINTTAARPLLLIVNADKESCSLSDPPPVKRGH